MRRYDTHVVHAPQDVLFDGLSVDAHQASTRQTEEEPSVERQKASICMRKSLGGPGTSGFARRSPVG